MWDVIAYQDKIYLSEQMPYSSTNKQIKNTVFVIRICFSFVEIQIKIFVNLFL